MDDLFCIDYDDKTSVPRSAQSCPARTTRRRHLERRTLCLLSEVYARKLRPMTPPAFFQFSGRHANKCSRWIICTKRDSGLNPICGASIYPTLLYQTKPRQRATITSVMLPKMGNSRRQSASSNLARTRCFVLARRPGLLVDDDLMCTLVTDVVAAKAILRITCSAEQSRVASSASLRLLCGSFVPRRTRGDGPRHL